MENKAYLDTEVNDGVVLRHKTVSRAVAETVDRGEYEEIKPRQNKDKAILIQQKTTMNMEKQVGLPSGVAFIVGAMIGSGIFISPKGVLSGSGSVAASLLIWAGSGVIALSACLCFAELGTMIPKSGGEFTYLKESLGPVPAFLSVWTTVVAIKTSSQAIIALSFARYVLTPLFDGCGPPDLAIKLVAAAVIVSVSLVNCYSAKLAARVQVIFTVIKVSALIVIIVGGIVKLSQGYTVHLSTGFEGTITSPSAIALAFYDGLWAYDGWNTLCYLTEELVNPSVNLPRSMLLGVPIVIVVYVLTNVSYLTVLSKEMVLASPAVAVSWGDHVLGAVSVVIPLAVACSTFGALNASCFSGGRLCYTAGREGHFPAILSYVHVHQLTPWCSLLFSTIGALIMVIPGNINTLINFFSFTAWLINGSTFLGLIVMRFTRKNWKRPYKVPIIIPVVMVLVSGFLVVAPIVQEPKIEILYAALFVVGGLIFYIPFVHFKIKLGCMDSFIKWVQLFLQVAPSKFEP